MLIVLLAGLFVCVRHQERHTSAKLSVVTQEKAYVYCCIFLLGKLDKEIIKYLMFAIAILQNVLRLSFLLKIFAESEMSGRF